MANEAIKIAEVLSKDLTLDIEKLHDEAAETPLREDYEGLRISYMRFLKDCFDGEVGSHQAGDYHENFEKSLENLAERLRNKDFFTDEEEYDEEDSEPTAEEYTGVRMIIDELPGPANKTPIKEIFKLYDTPQDTPSNQAKWEEKTLENMVNNEEQVQEALANFFPEMFNKLQSEAIQEEMAAVKKEELNHDALLEASEQAHEPDSDTSEDEDLDQLINTDED